MIANEDSEPVELPMAAEVAVGRVAAGASQVFVGSSDDGLEASVHEVHTVIDSISSSRVSTPSEGQVESPKCGHEDLGASSDGLRGTFTFPNGTVCTLPHGVSLKGLEFDEAVLAARLIREHEGAFSMDRLDLGYCTLIPHEINLVDNSVVNLPYRGDSLQTVSRR